MSCTGVIGADAELRYTPSGQAVLSLTVANHVGFGDKQKTIWLRVALWGKRAEGKLKDYLKKGQTVFVSGELSVNEYKANDGTNKVSLELNASVIDLLGNRNSNPETDTEVFAERTNTAVNVPYDDGVPF